MIRSERYKYITYLDDPVELFFDLENDPGETKNLALDQAYSSVLEDHRFMMQDWISRLDVAGNIPVENRWFVR